MNKTNRLLAITAGMILASLIQAWSAENPVPASVSINQIIGATLSSGKYVACQTGDEQYVIATAVISPAWIPPGNLKWSTDDAATTIIPVDARTVKFDKRNWSNLFTLKVELQYDPAKTSNGEYPSDSKQIHIGKWESDKAIFLSGSIDQTSPVGAGSANLHYGGTNDPDTAEFTLTISKSTDIDKCVATGEELDAGIKTGNDSIRWELDPVTAGTIVGTGYTAVFTPGALVKENVTAHGVPPPPEL